MTRREEHPTDHAPGEREEHRTTDAREEHRTAEAPADRAAHRAHEAATAPQDAAADGQDAAAEGAVAGERAAEGAVAGERAAEGAEVYDAAAEAGEGEDVTAEPDDTAELRAALDDAERAAEEYLDHLRRERAEFENFRRRSTKERMEALDRGAESLIGNLLGVLDNFGYTLEAARESADDRLGKGVEMVHTELMKVLTDAGLEEIPGVGQPFDPAVHEAMMQVDAADELGEAVEDPLVVEILRPGYRFKGRVLRPAAVKVAR